MKQSISACKMQNHENGCTRNNPKRRSLLCDGALIAVN